MTAFSDSDDVYRTIGLFLQELARSPGFGSALQSIGATLELDLTEPEATIVIKVDEAGAGVEFGSEEATATAIMSMSADTAHQIFSGQATFAGAIDRRELVISDAVAGFLPILPQLEFAAFPRYVELLEDLGRQDLL